VSFFDPWVSELKTTDAWTLFPAASEADLPKASAALKEIAAASRFTDEQRHVLMEALRTLERRHLFAVRSSSPNEDLEGASFAGGYETVLGVTEADLEDAIRRCFVSCLDHRVIVYMRANGFDATDPKIAVIVQEQIASEVSGVGFSLNPVTNNYDEAVFNSNWGLGETVVAGVATPDTFIVDKVHEVIRQTAIGGKEISIWLKEDGGTEEKKNFRSSETSLSDAQVRALTQLIKNVERHYQGFMDIEWAYAQDRLYLLQARPVTTYVPLAADVTTSPGQKKRLYFDVTVTAQGMNKPISKMGTSMFRRLLRVIGRIVFARNLTKDIDAAIPWISEGKIFFNLSAAFALAGKRKVTELMTVMDPLAAATVERLDEHEYMSPAWKIRILPYGLLTKLPSVLLMIYRAKRDPEAVHRWVEARLRRFEAEAMRIARTDTPLRETIDLLLSKVFFQVFRLTVPLTILSRFALGRLKKAAGNDPEASKLEVALPHNMTTEMGLALARVAALLPDDLDAGQLAEKLSAGTSSEECMHAWHHFLDAYGHRGPSEIDVAAPRYRDVPALFLDLLLVMKNSPGDDPQTTFERNQGERRRAYRSLHEKLHAQDPSAAEAFAKDYRFFETFGGYRETHKHYLVFVVASVRQKILAQAKALVAANRLDRFEQIFDLTLDQLDENSKDSSIDLRALAKTNTVFINKLARITRPPTIIDSRGFIPRPPALPAGKGEYTGVPISSGMVRGRIKVLHSPDEKPLEKGEILVARATDPGWTPLFVNAGGVVLEIGGLLQHGALVAREYGLPCVAGIENATSLWKDGTLVEIDGSAGVIRTIQE